MSYVQVAIGIILAIILIVAVAYPIVDTTINNMTATVPDENTTRSWQTVGTEATVLNLVPTLIVIGALVAIVTLAINKI